MFNEYQVLYKSKEYKHDARLPQKLALTVALVKSKQKTCGDTCSEKRFRDASTLIKEGADVINLFYNDHC